MKHSTRPPSKAHKVRFEHLRVIGCIACRIEQARFTCGLVEVHHLNLGGKAGQVRRGHEFTIPLGEWHHRGAPLPGSTAASMAKAFGPSLARSSRAFRERYGTDDELLAEVNRRIAAAL